jgi:plastocyanin
MMKRFLTGYPSLFPALAGLFFAWLLLTPPGAQAAEAVRRIAVTMGDYRFVPDKISVQNGETVELELTNTDSLTPHNFTLQAAEAGVELDVDVSAGKTKIVDITPLVPGIYRFYCNKKLPFMKSHRDRGMEGTLVVGPASLH